MSSRTINNIRYVDATELFQWLKQGLTSLGYPFRVIDVRGSDYVGGHIKGSWNYPYKRLSQDENVMNELRTRLAEATVNDEVMNVVFHCAQSQQRGPSAAMKFLRHLSDQELDKFKIWILRDGFNHWQDIYGADATVTEGYEPDLWSW
ncbi:hypothetical protein HG536_0E05030 [Torulaspora globosa]|uniref:Rhodanese domain-containing protein n=1 Tax=Torulaspora globosa TaxID=48254 RepID=A0A7G3ZJA6_9SACH|nr:uncharacterized protein HG536_0E05030 [Torulaspora globosa]QLL33592.1 hypothetical protein HG536_0E05030 [Torulaspora globosa]